jgi:hypothetical protein
MKRCILTIVMLSACLVAWNAGALDRNADLIDTLGVIADPFDGYDGVSGSLWGETAIASWGTEWAFTAGGQYGTFSPHRTESADYWEFGLGVKYTLPTLTALSATALYGQYDLLGSPEVRTGRIEMLQRLLPATWPISPFLTGSLALRSADAVAGRRDERLFVQNSVSSELVSGAGAGCDFSMTEDMSIVLQAVYLANENLPDGWTASVGMKYYWK